MVDESKLLITMNDVRMAGHCVTGIKEWFERHDMDFKEFIRNGLPASEVRAKGDALGARVIDRKLEREGL